MEQHCAYLSMGTNLGERAANLAEARRRIAEQIGPVRAASRIYRTAAWGLEDQPNFFNQVLCVDTALPAETVLEVILAIEQAMGRIRVGKWRQRLIDIDILFYDRDVIHTDRLVVPHPFIPQRRFVLAPLAEIAPDLRHPVLQKTVAELLSESDDPLFAEPLITDF